MDALEIHTQGRDLTSFRRLWEAIGGSVRQNLKLLAVSFPNVGTDEELTETLLGIYEILSNIPRHMHLVWQTDGRPMSGDIGRGTARAAVNLATRVRHLVAELQLPGYVQLAGGTNDATAPLLRSVGLLRTKNGVAGIAFGGYMRKVRACIVRFSSNFLGFGGTGV